MQAASPPLWSAHQVIFEFFFSFQKSKTSHFLFDLLIRFTAKMNLFTHWLHLPCPSSLTRSCSRQKWQNCSLAKITASFFPNAVFSSPAEEDEICSRIQINKKLSFKLLGDVKNKTCQIPFLGNASGEKFKLQLFWKVVSSVHLFVLNTGQHQTLISFILTLKLRQFTNNWS